MALWVGEYSDLCRSELEQQFLKRASALVSELCDEYCGKTGRKNGEVFTSPVRSAFYREKLLLLFIELDAISEVYIFKREHDHAGGGCWGRTDYHDFADRPSRIIRNVDSRSIPLWVNMCGSMFGSRLWVSSTVEALKERESTGSFRSAV